MISEAEARAELARLVAILRAARVKRKISQASLAADLELAPGSVVDWEVSRDRPTMLNLIRWTRSLDHMLHIVPQDEEPDLRVPRFSTAQSGWEAQELRHLVRTLHKARLAEKRSQAWVAAELGMNRWSITQWESSNGNPRPVGLIMWARSLEHAVRLSPV